mgnify:CR=1 FL=1
MEELDLISAAQRIESVMKPRLQAIADKTGVIGDVRGRGAMIAVEMMHRKLEEGYDKLRAATFAYSSTAFPMLSGTLITAAGFLPIGMARSAVGEYTFAIFAVTAAALLIS